MQRHIIRGEGCKEFEKQMLSGFSFVSPPVSLGTFFGPSLGHNLTTYSICLSIALFRRPQAFGESVFFMPTLNVQVNYPSSDFERAATDAMRSFSPCHYVQDLPSSTWTRIAKR